MKQVMAIDRTRRTMPFGSLILCILLVLVQMASWPVLALEPCRITATRQSGPSCKCR